LHKNTIEFTKDEEVSVKGDCIVAVSADFDANELKRFVSENKHKKVICEIMAGDIQDSFSFFFNPGFLDEHEIVIRKTEFKSSRTLGVKAEKAAKDLKRELVEKIKDKNIKIKVMFRV
jgi:hypothetical protein